MVAIRYRTQKAFCTGQDTTTMMMNNHPRKPSKTLLSLHRRRKRTKKTMIEAIEVVIGDVSTDA